MHECDPLLVGQGRVGAVVRTPRSLRSAVITSATRSGVSAGGRSAARPRNAHLRLPQHGDARLLVGIDRSNAVAIGDRPTLVPMVDLRYVRRAREKVGAGLPTQPIRWYMRSLSATSASCRREGARCASGWSSPSGPVVVAAARRRRRTRRRRPPPRPPPLLEQPGGAHGLEQRQRVAITGGAVERGDVQVHGARRHGQGSTFTTTVVGRTSATPNRTEAASTNRGFWSIASTPSSVARPSTAQFARNHGNDSPAPTSPSAVRVADGGR